VQGDMPHHASFVHRNPCRQYLRPDEEVRRPRWEPSNRRTASATPVRATTWRWRCSGPWCWARWWRHSGSARPCWIFGGSASSRRSPKPPRREAAPELRPQTPIPQYRTPVRCATDRAATNESARI